MTEFPGPSREDRPSAVARPSAGDLGLMAVAVGAVSTAAPLITAAAAAPLAIAFWRNALGAGLTLPFAVAYRRRELAGLTGRDCLLAGAAGVCLGLHFGTWIPALGFTTVATTVALTSTQPVWAALIARVRGQRIPVRAWLGIVIALLAAGALTGSDLAVSLGTLPGDILALAGGVFGAAYVTVGGAVRRRVSTATYTAVCYPVAAAGLLAVCLGLRLDMAGYAPVTWLMIAGITVGAQLLGHTVFNRVLQTTQPTIVSLAMLLEVPGAALLASVWLGQVPSPSAIPAILALLGGVALVLTAR